MCMHRRKPSEIYSASENEKWLCLYIKGRDDDAMITAELPRWTMDTEAKQLKKEGRNCDDLKFSLNNP